MSCPGIPDGELHTGLPGIPNGPFGSSSLSNARAQSVACNSLNALDGNAAQNNWAEFNTLTADSSLFSVQLMGVAGAVAGALGAGRGSTHTSAGGLRTTTAG